MTVDRIPAECFHPSEFILEELDERGWTLDDLATRMGGDFGIERLGLDFYLLKDDGVRLGETGAAGLARAFGTSKEFWLNLEKSWLEWRADQPNQR